MASKKDNTGNRNHKLSMRLVVDTNAHRVLYAEAGKDVVDFLFSLLTLPLGAVAKLTADGPMAGSVGNLYGSVRGMDARYVACSSNARNALLAPGGGHVVVGDVLQLPDVAEDQVASTTKSTRCFFRCSNEEYCDECCDYIAEAYGTPCPVCGGEMASELQIVREEPPASCACGGSRDAGFVHDLVTHTIKDDLSVAPMSTISGITLLKTFGVRDIGSLQEKTVQLSCAEGLEILRASLQSKTVLTDVYLGKKAAWETCHIVVSSRLI